MHPARLRCSSLAYSRYAHSSRLAGSGASAVSLASTSLLRATNTLALLGALALPGATALPSPQRVGVGLERVEEEAGEPLLGQRVGLIAHAASVTWDGRHALDVLRGVGVDVRRVFAPEHGWLSEAAAGAHIDGAVDAPVPVVSLYGDERRPTASDLMDLDTLVFDLQDGGVRFYTYISTMILSLQAASESGLRFVVLDRPNPLGGRLVEGPSRGEEMAPAFLTLAPGPLVHGLTAGEMARFTMRELQLDVRLEVVPLEGWRREMTWADTGRPWPMPSPNLRSAEAALAYPGVALLEATNVSEGRGTEAPFLLLGAPWLDAEALARRLDAPGYAFSITSFVPRSLAWAPAPKHEGERCRGIRVRVIDATQVSPFRLGLELLHALSQQPDFELDGTRLERLLGTSRMGEAFEAGLGPEDVIASLRPEIGAFRRKRASILLYPRNLQRVDPSAAHAVTMLPTTLYHGHARSVKR